MQILKEKVYFMSINKDEWNMIYQIEDRLNMYQEQNAVADIKFLLKLVWKLNGNIIDPKTHDKIQQIIDNLK